jgi:tRNA threonylcarbamoyladenosine biosynthesis protein TsaB
MSPPRLEAPLLAIETSTPVTRVAVLDGRTGARLAGAEAIAERHSSNLLRLCVEATGAAGTTIAELGAIACGAGPGSFTGLRVGLSVAKGLAMPRGLPLVVISSLEALALDLAGLAGAPSGSGASDPLAVLVPCIDAGKGQIFAAAFRRAPEAADQAGLGGSDPVDREAVLAPRLVALTPEVSVLPEALWEVVGALLSPETVARLAGPGAERYRDRLLSALRGRAQLAAVAGPTAEAVGRRALERLARGDADDLAGVVPSYGRAPDITRKAPPSR